MADLLPVAPESHNCDCELGFSKPDEASHMVEQAARANSSAEIVLVYGIDGSAAPFGKHYHEQWDLGRFHRNAAIASSLGVKVLSLAQPAGQVLSCATHGELPVEVSQASLVRDEAGSLQLRVTLLVANFKQIASVLACTCFERDVLMLSGVNFLHALRHQVQESVRKTLPTVLRFGRDVHSVVNLGRLPDGWTKEDSIRLVYRETALIPLTTTPLAMPAELNRFLGHLAMHGRGVTVIAGHERTTVDACTLVVHHLLFGMQNLRGLAAQSQTLLERAALATPRDSQLLSSEGVSVLELGKLANEAQRLEISLAFEIETPLHSGVLPEMVLDSYRDSLEAVVGLTRSIDVVSTTLSRVRAFLSSAFEELNSQQQSERLERESTRIRIAALVSAIAIPTSLLLALLGISASEIRPDASMFASYYWPIWLGFLLTITMGLVAVFKLTTSRPSTIKPAATKLSAHRGGPEGRFAPNSIAAMEASLGLGAVDLIEFDVRVTKDGRFVTTHDAKMNISGADVAIENLTAREVFRSQPDAAALDDVLLLLRGRAIAHVDLKDTICEVEIADRCELILGADNFILTTLEDCSVRALRKARPHLQVALSLGRASDGLSHMDTLKLRTSELFPRKRVRACDPTMLAVNFTLAKRGILRWATRNQIPVLVWTLNTPELMMWAWRDSRIWGFTTDFPATALAVRTGRKKLQRS